MKWHKRLYRRLRYRKGYGVHSPFVYNLITKIIEEKSSFYAFGEIENFRHSLLKKKDSISEITSRETQSPAYGALLFRLAHYFKCRSILEIGASSGVMALYLAMASKQCNCRLWEPRAGLLQALQDYALTHHLQKVSCEEKDFRTLSNEKNAPFDLIFINQIADVEDEKTIWQTIRPFIDKHTVLIINDINRNPVMQKTWKLLKNEEYARTMIDIDFLGLVFFNDKLPKKQYKAYLKNGKKQNLYKNRR